MPRAKVLAASIVALLAGGALSGDRLLARSALHSEAAIARGRADDTRRELENFERLLASKGKTVPRAIAEELSRGTPQDVIVMFMAADVEETITRQGARGSDARRLRAERYASRKRAAISPWETDLAVLREYTQLPMVHLRVRTAEALDRVLARPEVGAVYEDSIFRLKLAESLPLIGQPAAAAAGHRGAGTTVVVLDSGVDYTRAAFGSCTAPNQPAGCRVVVSEDLAPPDGVNDDPIDSIFHGTLVSAIVLGAAPESRLAVFDVFEREQARFSAILGGLDWAIVNRDRYNVVAVNLSIGGVQGDTAPCIDGGYTPVVQLLRSEGIVVVAASGNENFTNRLVAPACTPGVVSVGAVYDANVGPVSVTDPDCTDPTTRADQVMCFSNSASFLTLLAPGGRVTAAGQSGFGTSLSAPLVSGAVAALRGSYPTETPDQITARMVSTGTPVTDTRNGLTFPRLALDRAAASPSPPAPPPRPACPAQRVTCPATITGNLSPASCGTGRLSDGHFTDAYEFSGVSGQSVTIQLSSSLPPDRFDSFLVLVSPSGRIAAQNDDVDLAVNVNSRIVFTLTETGTWRVEASTFSPGMTGAYTLSISGCSAPTPFVCTPGSNTLCLSGGRFRVQATWRTPGGQSGSGTAVSLTPDTGFFWFFDPANVEMIAKVLNACGVNQRLWVFAGGLTNVEVALTVADSSTGSEQTYRNPQGVAFLPIQDTQAFSSCSASASPSSAAATNPETPVHGSTDPRAATASAACTPETTALCLSGGRFRVTAAWRAADGRSGVGTAQGLTADTGYFWFFEPQNVEIVVKVLNACGVNQRIWTFAGGLTNVEVTMTVEDTNTGVVRTYRNSQGAAFQPIQDTGAFATCP